MKVLIRNIDAESTAYKIYDKIEIIHAIGGDSVVWIGEGNYAPPEICDEIVDMTITISLDSIVTKQGARLLINE